MSMELVERTWAEVGYRIRPLRFLVFVRTEPPEKKVGSLFLIDKDASFYGGLPHQRLVRATVLSAGPAANVKVGERVCFTRLHFARYKTLEDGTHVGWISSNEIAGYPDSES